MTEINLNHHYAPFKDIQRLSVQYEQCVTTRKENIKINEEKKYVFFFN